MCRWCWQVSDTSPTQLLEFQCLNSLDLGENISLEPQKMWQPLVEAKPVCQSLLVFVGLKRCFVDAASSFSILFRADFVRNSMNASGNAVFHRKS